jgi:PIN domain nuclease of toxin-antitoxin system
MNLLLDTCILIWLAERVEELSERARNAIKDRNNNLYYRAASVFELGIANSFKPMSKKIPIDRLINRVGALYELKPLHFTVGAAHNLQNLPSIHKDPFDRMLICQALTHKFTLLTPDEQIHRYPVKYVW